MQILEVPVLASLDTSQRDAIAFAEGRDPRDRRTHVALGFGAALILLAFVGCALLTGCTPGQQVALETAASVGKEVACALCQKPLDPPPAPAKAESPTVDELLSLLSWAAGIQARMTDVERKVTDELAKRALAAPAVTEDRSSVAPAPTSSASPKIDLRSEDPK